MIETRLIKSALLALGVLLPVTGAADAEKYPRAFAFSEDPSVYDMGFQTALASGLVREFHGTDYYTYLNGDLSHRPVPAGGRPLCVPSDFPEAWLANPGRCDLVKPHEDGKACRNVDGCGNLLVDPATAHTPRLAKLIVSTLENPCASLRDPKTLASNREKNTRARGLKLGASEAWMVLRCATARPIRARDITVDAEAGLIRYRF